MGANRQVAQAEANKNMAQAQAEIRRAAAVALEQEMKARIQEMQAKVVDFGLALFTEQGPDRSVEIWATPYYVAPEKILHNEEDYRSASCR